MRNLIPALVFFALLSPAASASEEHLAGWTSVTFTCQPAAPFPQTTVTVETAEEHSTRRIASIRVTNAQFDLHVPREAFSDLVAPMISTVQLSTEAGYDKTPWMYVTFKLGNPKAGAPWDFPTAYIQIKDGKVVGRALRRINGGQIKYEDLAYSPTAAPSTAPAAPQKGDVSLELSIAPGAKTDARRELIAVLTIRNATYHELKVQNPHKQMAVTFLVTDSLGNVVKPVGRAKVDSGPEATGELTLTAGAVFTDRREKLEYLSGSALFGYDLPPGSKCRIIAIYRPFGDAGPAVASQEVTVTTE